MTSYSYLDRPPSLLPSLSNAVSDATLAGSVTYLPRLANQALLFTVVGDGFGNDGFVLRLGEEKWVLVEISVA